MKPCGKCGAVLENKVKTCPKCGRSQEQTIGLPKERPVVKQPHPGWDIVAVAVICTPIGAYFGGLQGAAFGLLVGLIIGCAGMLGAGE